MQTLVIFRQKIYRIPKKPHSGFLWREEPREGKEDDISLYTFLKCLKFLFWVCLTFFNLIKKFTIVNNTVLYIWKLARVDLKSSHYRKKKLAAL